jgi:hypothetical protein
MTAALKTYLSQFVDQLSAGIKATTGRDVKNMVARLVNEEMRLVTALIDTGGNLDKMEALKKGVADQRARVSSFFSEISKNRKIGDAFWNNWTKYWNATYMLVAAHYSLVRNRNKLNKIFSDVFKAGVPALEIQREIEKTLVQR